MVRMKARGGFALAFAMVSVLVVSLVVGSVLGYVSQGVRASRVSLAKDRCRLAAQSAIEEVKLRIQRAFSEYVGASGTSVRIDPREAEAYNWFDHVSNGGLTIGLASSKTEPLTIDGTVEFNDCTVEVRIGRHVEHESNSSIAAVPVVATATYVYPDGLSASATIQECVCFATGQSKVFDYAYFVNNYGWMTGNSIYINGDMRANGNVELSGSTVNGFIYAAVNDEVGADGSVTLKSSPRIRNASTYRSYAPDGARPDVYDYDTVGAYDAPSYSGTITKDMTAASSGKSIVNEEAEPIPMPFVSDLDNYVEYAEEKGGTLTCPEYTYTDSSGAEHTIAEKSVSAHYEGVGPSEDADLADKGALVLIGTQSDPIEISGPVVVDSDVVISGYVSGKGTIYSGRNIHIIGDVVYKSSPSWDHPDSDDSSTEAENATKDLLGLVAKGNIVVGDASDSTWYSNIKSYIDGGRSSVVESYACDESDAAIGYPSTFGGSYTATEKVSGLSGDLVEVADTCGGYDSSSGQFGKVRTVELSTTHVETYTYYDWWGRPRTEQRVVYDKALETQYDRKYYETVCDDAVLSSLKNANGICRIDAVLYNNHGIFGVPGRSGYTFNLNGSLICRDEALYFKQGNGINFNWDIRLKRKADDNDVTSSLGLPVGPQDPYTVSWIEGTTALNPAFDAEGGGE